MKTARTLAASAATVNTEEQQRDGTANLIPFRPGQSGNPRGRPKGSRNKIAEVFLQDAHEAWDTHGRAALEKMATEEPGKFVMMIASLVPKEFDVKPAGSLQDLSDAELMSMIEQLTDVGVS